MADEVLFTARGLDKLERAMLATPTEVHKAERRAMKRTITWARKQMLRAGSESFGVPQSRLKKAQRSAMVVRDGGGRVWFGTKPLRSGYAGTPRQQKRAAKVGKHKFPGAFVATMASGYTGIFKRVGKSRLPIREHVIKSEGITDSFMQWLAAHADQRLLEQFVSDLEFYSGRRV